MIATSYSFRHCGEAKQSIDPLAALWIALSLRPSQ
jgi:hypothetical protein